MHKVHISQDILDRAMARRGALEVYPDIEPRRTALLVIDLQNAFVASGQPGELVYAREIVDNVNRIAKALRHAGGKVAWIKHTNAEAAGSPWPRFMEFSAAGWGKALTDALVPGSEGHEIYPGLQVEEQDDIVFKTRFSAFIQGSSDLHERLQAQGIDTLIVTGTITNVCCESTARDAMMLNYKVHFISDANAARTDAEHNGTLANMLLWFADVRSTDLVIDRIRQAAA
ncbi:MAG: cysteine hydrolase [Pusillimonas sp.]